MMGKKRSLVDLIQGEVTKTPSSEVTELQTTELPELQSAEVFEGQELGVKESTPSPKYTISPSSAIQLQTIEGQELQSPEIPKYLTLVRKETRLRDDQLEQLTNLTRQLNRQRRGQGERITENTLIRLAVDLLLSQSNQLQGTTEEELKTALRLD
jgi:hypothetical protein